MPQERSEDQITRYMRPAGTTQEIGFEYAFVLRTKMLALILSSESH